MEWKQRKPNHDGLAAPSSEAATNQQDPLAQIINVGGNPAVESAPEAARVTAFAPVFRRELKVLLPCETEAPFGDRNIPATNYILP